ncbi:MAG TPA: hypothetical protein VFA80_03215 [Xanthobacteraceae bacterium]|jgi:ElaB/YqjD/DUF883 family membrane-anchored ribosome-binding protein|nr:hypothetical protein [Xanthobacteraceae bacterium]
MDTTQAMRDTARDAAKEAREGIREAGNAAAAASGDFQNDLQALRDDLARLADQVRNILTNKGSAAWQRAKTRADGVMSDAQSKGQEAASAVRDVSGHFADAIDESIKNRPYTTLVLAVGLGFLLGTNWRR